MEYPSKVANCIYGKCLVAEKDLPAGTIVENFNGLIVSKDDIPTEEIFYVILIDKDKWMIPISNARYLNHSCCPNCKIDNNFNIVTIRPVKSKEELTISYNTVYENEDPGEWDPRWTFTCLCKSKNCQGVIDKYVTADGKPWISKNHDINKPISIAY